MDCGGEQAHLSREDFYYRLNVLPINPPPRERKGDIPYLVDHFLSKYSADTGNRVEAISLSAMEKLSGSHWPGNVRELENIIERAMVLSRSKIMSRRTFTWIRSARSLPPRRGPILARVHDARPIRKETHSRGLAVQRRQRCSAAPASTSRC